MADFTYMLSPLEDTSDTALRHLCHKYGADLTFTEMAYAFSLAKNNAGTKRKIAILDDTPTMVQLIVSKEYVLKTFLASYTPPKSFKGFNLNLGCPSPDVVGFGLGCAMIKRVNLTKILVNILKDNGYACSIKMRLGLNQFEKNKKTYLNLIKEVDADFFIVHARHGKQTYDEPADLSVYAACVRTGKRIIANGDIDSIEKINFLKSVGVHGAMIGRAAVRDPAIFNRLKGIPAPSAETLSSEYEELAKTYQTPKKYVDNVLKRMGVQKSQYHHING